MMIFFHFSKVRRFFFLKKAILDPKSLMMLMTLTRLSLNALNTLNYLDLKFIGIQLWKIIFVEESLISLSSV